MDSLKVLLFPIPLGKHAGWSEWVVMGSFPMFAVVGIHEFSLARMDPFAVVAEEVGFWKSFLCFVIEKEFQFQECGHQFHEGGATVSILAARMKSFSERPPIAWV